MRWLISLVLIVALAVGAAIAAKVNSGYLLLVYPPYRVEVSLPFAVAALVLGFFAVYFLIRVADHTLRLPRVVSDYRRRRARYRARNAMDQALSAYFEGHYRRAEKFAAAALKLQESPALSAIVAARAAHAQRNTESRDSYLKAADTVVPETNLLKLVTQAEFLLEDRRHNEALEILKTARELAPKNPALLKLEMKAHTLARNWEQVLNCVTQLARLKDADKDQLEPIRLTALKENLKLKGNDSELLKEQWKKIASADRLDPGIAQAAARAFAALNLGESASAILERSLEQRWDTELVAFYGEVIADDTLKQIERAETWLPDHPNDAALLLTLGKLCARERLWGKAQSYIEASLAVEPSRAAHAAYAKLMERIGKPELALSYNRRRS